MFKSIQEGLEIFRKKLEEHFQETKRVAERAKQYRDQHGVDYRGISDWPKEDYEAFNTRYRQLVAMATALGLSQEEFKSNWEDVERQLGIRMQGVV